MLNLKHICLFSLCQRYRSSLMIMYFFLVVVIDIFHFFVFMMQSIALQLSCSPELVFFCAALNTESVFSLVDYNFPTEMSTSKLADIVQKYF